MTSQAGGEVTTGAFEGGRHAQTSLILGIVGLIFLPLAIIFGPLAIGQAKKAERWGVPATLGKTVGWIATLLWILGLCFVGIAALFILPNLGH